MEWLTQNWTYLLLLLGVILFVRFGGMSCGFGGRRAHPGHGPKQQAGEDTPFEASPPIDPVGRRPVDPKAAVATMYQGRVHYFESRKNRDRFEAAPRHSPARRPRSRASKDIGTMVAAAAESVLATSPVELHAGGFAVLLGRSRGRFPGLRRDAAAASTGVLYAAPLPFLLAAAVLAVGALLARQTSAQAPH